MEEDRRLVRRILEDSDDGAFRALYRRHNGKLYRFALRLTGGVEQDAEDALQETWIRATRRLADFGWRSALSTWLSGVLIRCVQEQRRKRRPAVPMTHGESPRRPPDLEAVTDLRRAFERMPAGYRTVVTLFAEGFTHEEIGRMLDITPGTSKSQLSRGRRWLREALEADG